MLQEKIVCPSCYSDQISANQKGFNMGTGALGYFTGGALQGIALGSMGSGKIIITCLKCANKFQPGEGAIKTFNDETGESSITFQDPPYEKARTKRTIAFIIIIVMLLFIIGLLT
ncbi:MAG: hypothetical protein H0X33_02830 [Taibaiella sp.]|nr:hypothetical protein [Taibaiella sp.]